ncbi:MAG: response regulator [Cyclobacteriaceae bacterium]
MSIEVLIVEDNPLTAQDLSEQLTENGMTVVGIANSAEKARELFEEYTPDVLLVDIKLKGEETGIDFVKGLNGEKPIIYLSANSDNETVDEALMTNPSTFLTKPFDEKDVKIAIELAFNKHSQQLIENERSNNHQGDLPVFLKSGNRYEKVRVDDITYLEADGSYCKVMTKQKEFLIAGNLNSFNRQIGNNKFVRVHRSFVVNLNAVSGMDNDYIFVGDQSIPVGRSYKPEVKAVFRRFS